MVARISPDEAEPVRPGDWAIEARGRMLVPGRVDGHAELGHAPGARRRLTPLRIDGARGRLRRRRAPRRGDDRARSDPGRGRRRGGARRPPADRAHARGADGRLPGGRRATRHRRARDQRRRRAGERGGFAGPGGPRLRDLSHRLGRGAPRRVSRRRGAARAGSLPPRGEQRRAGRALRAAPDPDGGAPGASRVARAGHPGRTRPGHRRGGGAPARGGLGAGGLEPARGSPRRAARLRIDMAVGTPGGAGERRGGRPPRAVDGGANPRPPRRAHRQALGAERVPEVLGEGPAGFLERVFRRPAGRIIPGAVADLVLVDALPQSADPIEVLASSMRAPGGLVRGERAGGGPGGPAARRGPLSLLAEAAAVRRAVA